MYRDNFGNILTYLTQDFFSGYPEPWSSKLKEVIKKGLIRFTVFFLHVSPDVFNFFPQT